MNMLTQLNISFGRDDDALYIRFKETTVITKHADDGFALDYDDASRLAGIQFLDAAERLAKPDTLRRVVFENGARSETANRTIAAP